MSGPEFVPHGSLSVRWNSDGSLACIHADDVPCQLAGHTTIPTFSTLQQRMYVPAMPTPTDLVRALRNTLGLPAGALAVSPKAAWDVARLRANEDRH